MTDKALATLLARKFPDRPKPHRKAPAWMPAELAAIYTQIGADTVIAPFYGRLLSPAGCKSERATKLASIGMAGWRTAWPKAMSRLVFHHGRDERHQGHAALVYLDRKRLEAFVTLDDIPEARVLVQTIDRMLKKLGLLVDVIDDPKHRARVVKRFQRYLDG